MNDAGKPFSATYHLCHRAGHCPVISRKQDGTLMVHDADQSGPGQVNLNAEQAQGLLKVLSSLLADPK